MWRTSGPRVDATSTVRVAGLKETSRLVSSLKARARASSITKPRSWSVAITWRSGDSEKRTFAFVHGLLKPALECLRRELISHDRFESLRRSISDRDRDLDVLLLATAAPESSEGGDEVGQRHQENTLPSSSSRAFKGATVASTLSRASRSGVRALPGHRAGSRCWSC